MLLVALLQLLAPLLLLLLVPLIISLLRLSPLSHRSKFLLPFFVRYQHTLRQYETACHPQCVLLRLVAFRTHSHRTWRRCRRRWWRWQRLMLLLLARLIALSSDSSISLLSISPFLSVNHLIKPILIRV